MILKLDGSGSVYKSCEKAEKGKRAKSPFPYIVTYRAIGRYRLKKMEFHIRHRLMVIEVDYSPSA